MSENETKKIIKVEKETVLKNIKERMSQLAELSQTMLQEGQEKVKTDLSILEKKWEIARDSLEKLGSTTEDAWQEVATGFEEAWEDLIQNFGKAIQQFKQEGIAFQDKWDFYQDSSHKWHWRYADLDEQIFGSSHKGFQTRKKSEENARLFGYQENEMITPD